MSDNNSPRKEMFGDCTKYYPSKFASQNFEEEEEEEIVDGFILLNSSDKKKKQKANQSYQEGQSYQSTNDELSSQNISDFQKNFNDLEDSGTISSYHSSQNEKNREKQLVQQEQKVSDQDLDYDKLDFEDNDEHNNRYTDSDQDSNNNESPMKIRNQDEIKQEMVVQKIQEQQQQLVKQQNQKSVKQFMQEKQKEYMVQQRMEQQKQIEEDEQKSNLQSIQISQQKQQLDENQENQSQLISNAKKTLVSSSTKILQEVSEIQKQKDTQEFINEAYIARKRESFNLVQQWEEQRSEFLQSHKDICQSLMNQIDGKIQQSVDSMKTIYNFFNQRKENELAYAFHLKNNMPRLSSLSANFSETRIQNLSDSALQRKNDIKKNQNKMSWYPALTEALGETDIITDVQMNKIQGFAVYLDKTIMKEILDVEMNEYQNSIKKCKQNLVKYQTLIKKSETQTIQKSQKYTKIYQQSIDKSQKKKKDLYNWELKYRKVGFQEINHYREYGKVIMNIFEETKRVELKRISTIQKAFQEYISKHTDTYGHNKQLEHVLEIFNAFNPQKERNESFSIRDNLLTQEQTDFITQGQQGINETKLNTILQDFLYNFQCPDVDQMESGQHRLILKKYKAYKDVGTIGLSWKPIELVFTIDDFLLFFDADDHINLRPSQRKMGCDKIRVQKRDKNNKEQNMCYIVENKQGVIFNSKQKLLVKFEDADQLTEFKFFLHRYCPPKDLEIN